MSRLTITKTLSLISSRTAVARTTLIEQHTGTRTLSTTRPHQAGSQNSTPGWSGRPKEDHAVNRSPHDVQAKSSKEGMQDKQADHKGEHTPGGSGISEKDEGGHAKKAKEEFPEAPGPIIGMNSERGAKGSH